MHKQLRQDYSGYADGSNAFEYSNCIRFRKVLWKPENRNGRQLDLIDAMIEAADDSVSDEQIAEVERHACPGCGSCSGMFTANSMNCLNEAIGLALPGNGTIVATHANRLQLFRDAAKLVVENAYKYYRDGDDSVLPRKIATRQAFLNAMSLE